MASDGQHSNVVGNNSTAASQPGGSQATVSFAAEVHISSQLPAPPEYRPEPEDIVQVVYHSNENGSLVGVESSLVGSRGGGGGSNAFVPASIQHYNNSIQHNSTTNTIGHKEQVQSAPLDGVGAAHQQLQQQQSRATSSLPSVAEESSSGAAAGWTADESTLLGGQYALSEEATSRAISQANENFQDTANYENQHSSVLSSPQYSSAQYSTEQQQQFYGQQNPNAIYSTVNKQTRFKTFGHGEAHTNGSNDPLGSLETSNEQLTAYEQVNGSKQQHTGDGSLPLYSNLQYNQPSSLDQQQRTILGTSQSSNFADSNSSSLQKHLTVSEEDRLLSSEHDETSQQSEQTDIDRKLVIAEVDDISERDINEEISHILSRKGGAAESGSFRHNFRKKLGISVSTNENDLTAHRQKLLEAKEAGTHHIEQVEDGEPSSLPKFKRTHSVSFNVGSARTGRHSVDIRNLPSYLTVKRASIVDVAKGAMSSLMHSFGTGSSAASQRRDSSPDEEPIFEEPIAPTLSLGQRVALVKNSGAEFGTVGWIGQLPDVDDDWIVGVIFDNMIGNCDGAHNGVRYFYARENYAMFVPLSVLTKTDNYIGRPETGTMLSRMSVSLKPGQLISIQRSSIRLQHCFLNAPHQRVGHDVRAVSNRLHCQCHNCGPCAHLTKQGRLSALPAFGAHHAPNKKNSLAHAAVEILAHHHHHYHEEEHKEDDYQFGDNAAHACNFVRYSCCQQSGAPGHDFSADCEMVRPELLDNIIHAPRAPHRRTRPRRRRPRGQQQQQQQQLTETQQQLQIQQQQQLQLISPEIENAGANLNFSTLDNNATVKSWNESEMQHHRAESESSYSSTGSSSLSSSAGEVTVDGQHSNQGIYQTATSSYQYDHSTSYQNNNEYNTIDSRMSIIDQQRFIYQRDSSALLQPMKPSRFSNSEFDIQTGGIGAGIRRCFACILGRKTRRRSKPKKRKLSARNRMNEYRRRQSTFVPSTLAKPHEDFASHGIILPSTSNSQRQNQDSNSDYSSYSKSSCSSRSSSPGNDQAGNGKTAMDEPTGGFQQEDQRQQQTMTMELGAPNTNEQLKSCQTLQGSLNYDDYTFSDGHGSYKKDGYSRESALTDLGYFDSLNSSSNDTLKQIIDQSINEQVGLPEPLAMDQAIAAISPFLSNDGSDPSEQIDISSPTASLAEQSDECACQKMGCLDLDKDPDFSSDQ